MPVIGELLSRTIFEGDPQKFQDRLDARIKAHDKEIERMCNYHYQGFIESVRGLLQVRGDVENLKVSTCSRPGWGLIDS